MSLIGRLLHLALPLLKLRSRLSPVSLGVRGLLFDRDGAVLLVKHTYLPEWHFPGGGVEPGETAACALKRELEEEAGARLVGEPRLLGVYHNATWAQGDHVAFYEAGPWAHCEPRPGIEIQEARFFALHRLPPDAAPSVIDRLAERAGARASPRW